MQLSLREVTQENWQQCIKLAPHENQREFVAPNVFSLAESKFYPSLVPLAIYDGDLMVGFLMWGTDSDEPSGDYWIVRLMVDQQYQGKGYGRASMVQILDELKVRPDCKTIKISYHPDNVAADRLYASLGFVKTGEILDGELVARLAVRE